MPYHFPYTNLHDLDLDWMLNQVKDAKDKVDNFTSEENYNNIVNDAVERVENSEQYTETMQDVVAAGTAATEAAGLANTAAERANSAAATADNISALIGAPFSDSVDYGAGWIVTYNGALYRFITYHPAGAWNPNDVVATTVNTEVAQTENALSGYAKNISRATLRNINWVQGGIRSNAGTNSPNEFRIRTPGADEGYYKVGLINHVYCDDGYRFTVFLYTNTSADYYLGVYNGISWPKESYWAKDLFLNVDHDWYFRVVLAKVANADSTENAITPADANHIHFDVSTDTSLSFSGVPADAEATGQAIADAVSNDNVSLRIMQYNIGDYVWGFTPYDPENPSDTQHTLTPAQYAEKLTNYKAALADIQPDILCVEEFNQNFWVDNNGTKTSYPALANLFTPLFASSSIAGGSTNTTAIFSQLRRDGYESVWVQGINKQVLWRIAKYTLNGKKLAVCAGYLSPSDSSGLHMDDREAQLAFISNYVSTLGYDNVIIGSDMNCSAETTYEGPFPAVVNAYPALAGVTDNSPNNYSAIMAVAHALGFTCANDSFFGTKNTYVNHNGTQPGNIDTVDYLKPLDNILVKGNIKIKSFNVRTDLYNNLSSDHCPIVSDIVLYSPAT